MPRNIHIEKNAVIFVKRDKDDISVGLVEKEFSEGTWVVRKYVYDNTMHLVKSDEVDVVCDEMVVVSNDVKCCTHCGAFLYGRRFTECPQCHSSVDRLLEGVPFIALNHYQFVEESNFEL